MFYLLVFLFKGKPYLKEKISRNFDKQNIISKDEFQQYKNNRNNINLKMTSAEKNNIQYENNIQLKEEAQRRARLKDYDNNIQNKYSELQGKLLS